MIPNAFYILVERDV